MSLKRRTAALAGLAAWLAVPSVAYAQTPEPQVSYTSADSGAKYILIALIGSVVAPTILVLVQSRTKRRERAQDAEIAQRQKDAEWRRQDALAKRAEDRQDALAAKVDDTAERLLAEAARQDSLAAERQTITETHLEAIHLLGNSTLTAAKTAELNALEDGAVSLRIIQRLVMASGHEADPEAQATIDRMDKRIERLVSELAERALSDAAATVIEESA